MKKLGMLVVACLMVMLIIAACAPGAPAPAGKAPYKVGFTAAMTGPGAAGQLESTEGFRIYINTLNAKGGIDGHPIEVIFEDDRAEGAKAVANVKKFVSLGVNLIGVDSLSAVYAGVIGEATKANIPVLSFCIAMFEASPPKPDRLLFSVAHGGLYHQPPDGVSHLTKILAGGKPCKLAVMTADLPVANRSGDRSVEVAKVYGGIETMLERVPMGMPDLTPVASKFIGWKADQLHYWGPGAPAYLIGDAMLKLGWKGIYHAQLVGGSFESVFGEGGRWKGVENFISAIPTVPAILNLPEHKPIFEAAKAYSCAVPVCHKVVDGWLSGQVVAEIFKRASYPVDTEKLLAVMNKFEFDRKPLAGPVKWTATDHVGPRWYGNYQWKGGKVVGAVKKHWIGVAAGAPAGTILGEVESPKDIK